jgi:ABC-type uncharacterized transport system ATPase subunit
MTKDVPLLQVEGITKRFGHIIANAGIDFDLRAGEVHALVGENGAGKTTLMQILFGMLHPDSGTIRLNGKPVQFKQPKDAISHGIGMVHQHFMLVPQFTVAENVTLGAEQARGGLLRPKATARALERPMQLLGMHVALDAVSSTLSVAQQQQLEILKVLYRGARIMILDEPTAVLTPQETTDLFATLRVLADDGYAVIFISHKLREVMAVADRVTVLRSGATIETFDAGDVDIPTIVAAMTGRTNVNLGHIKRDRPGLDVVLDIESIFGRQQRDASIKGVSFCVHSGEIVGIAGVDGNGQASLVGLITGGAPIETGLIRLNGKELNKLSVSARRSQGLAYVPEDRHAEGLPMSGSVLDGLAGERLSRIRGLRGWAPAFTRELRSWANSLVDRYSIKTAGIDVDCRTLSGGNQQKVVIARELASNPTCIVLAQPTRGVDLGAAEFVYSAIAKATATGTAAVLVSADLDELLRVSDRILVFYRGAIVAERRPDNTTREELGHFMAGAYERSAA